MDFSMIGIAEVLRLISARRLSARELVDESLTRIHKYAHLNAFITVTDDLARRRAQELDALPPAARGPLHGIPYAAKDVIATRGIRTTNGSRVTEDWIPSADAAVIARLHTAGAVLVGKLNLWEFAMSGPSHAGEVHNPWSAQHSPGGSSSGSGAAVAAGLVSFALGTDTGGSIRVPAAWCGVSGLRPTYDSIPRAGVTVNAWTVDTVGPLAPSVDDVARVFGAVADGRPAGKPPGRRPMKGLRLGVPRTYFFDDMHPGVERAVAAALDRLVASGMWLVEIDVPHAALAAEVRMLHLAESAQYHEQRLRERGDLFGPGLRARLQEAQTYSAVDYVKALRVRALLQDEVMRVFERCDLFATPTDVNPPQMVAAVPKTATAEPRNRGNTFLASMTGIPALAIPCGIVEGPPALPVSLQLHGRPFDEEMLFDVGREFQRVTEWHRRTVP